VVSNNVGRASIHHVANRAGVSAATVSKVLRGVKTVKPANVEKVLAAVKELDYRIDPLASDLRRAKRRIIGVIIPELESEFFGRLTSRLETLAEAAGYSLAIATSQESEERELKLVERMHDWRVAGTILAPVRSERGLGATAMKKIGMTAVLVDRVVANDTFDTVTADNANASAQIARKLAEAGHKHVLLLGLNEVSKSLRTRISAFREEIEKSGAEMKVDLLLAEGPLDDLRQAFSNYLDETRPTAVFSLFQRGTLVVLSEFRRRAIQCPQDISVVGFDDAEWMQATYPAVTAVVQPIRQIAERAFERLLLRIETPQSFAVCQLQPCTFVERESLVDLKTAVLRPEQNRRRHNPPG